jgi:hypothetical protein
MILFAFNARSEDDLMRTIWGRSDEDYLRTIGGRSEDDLRTIWGQFEDDLRTIWRRSDEDDLKESDCSDRSFNCRTWRGMDERMKCLLDWLVSARRKKSFPVWSVSMVSENLIFSAIHWNKRQGPELKVKLDIRYICWLQLCCHPVAVVQYTFTHKQYTERHKRLRKSAGRAPSLRVLHWHLPYKWGKPRKNLSQGSRRVPVGTMKKECTEQNIHKNNNTKHNNKNT